MKTNLYTGHEAEIDEMESLETAWSRKPLAERQIDVMRAHIESALEAINAAGGTLCFELMSTEQAAEIAIRQIKQALAAAEYQSKQETN